MLRLPWRAGPNDYGQLVKVSCERGSPLRLHTHDYPELFWIDEGPCRHSINGREEVLDAGDLVFIRARDRHQLWAISPARFTMTNLECRPALIRELKKRHTTPFAFWFDERPSSPRKIRLRPFQLRQLQQLSLGLTGRPPNLLNIEGFCLDMARLLSSEQILLPGITECPDWLQDALLKAQFSAVFVQGTAGLFQVAKRSPEHVARLCQKHLKKTPTRIIEQFRMTDAEQKLRLTSQSITEIALSCGYSTTAQFHRAFKMYYFKTPLRYRRWIRGSGALASRKTRVGRDI